VTEAAGYSTEILRGSTMLEQCARLRRWRALHRFRDYLSA